MPGYGKRIIPEPVYMTMRRALQAYGGDDGKMALEWLEQQPLEGLTPHEIDVVRFVVQGFSNEEIGRLLHITEKTVKSLLTKIYAKTYIQSRVQLVIWAVRRGIAVIDREA